MNDVCTGCGEPNPPGTQFCLFCGIYLGWDERDADAPPAARTGTGPARPAGEPPPTDTTAPIPQRDATIPMERATAPAPAPAPPAQVATAAAVPTGRVCPSCGHENEPERRFCGHCGQVMATGAPARAAEPRRRGWWQRVMRSDSRVARRAYRRSLPPLYRWRRVGVTALVGVLVVGGFAVVGRDPVGWTMDRWYDVTNRLDPVGDVTAQALPESSVIGDHGPNGLLDLDPATAWVTGWTPTQDPPRCGEGRGGRVVLAFPETRVRELHVLTGVTDASDRPLQHIPTRLDVQLPDGSCRTVTLERGPEVQEVAFDTGETVSRLTVSIGQTHTADDERVQDVAGLTQLTLLARPARD